MAPGIAAVILARNEERDIGRAIESVLWCNETILIDMESTDRTVDVARQVNPAVKVMHHPYTPNFDGARQVGMDAAEHEWVLILDADEYVPETLRIALRAVVQGPDDVDVIRIPRKNLFLGTWMKDRAHWPNYVARAFRRGMVSAPRGLHGDWAYPENARVRTFPADERYAIEHQWVQSIDAYWTKIARYTTEEVSERLQHGMIKAGPLGPYRTVVQARGTGKVLPARFELGAMLWEAFLWGPVKFLRDRYWRYGVPGLIFHWINVSYRLLIWFKLWDAERLGRSGSTPSSQ